MFWVSHFRFISPFNNVVLIKWTEETFMSFYCEIRSRNRCVLPSAGPDGEANGQEANVAEANGEANGEVVCISWSRSLFGFLHNLFRPFHFKSTADVSNLLSDGQECDLCWATGLPLSPCSYTTALTGATVAAWPQVRGPLQRTPFL